MRPPWRRGAVKLVPQRPAVVVPPDPTDISQWPDRTWQEIAEMRGSRISELEAEVAALRATAALARSGQHLADYLALRKTVLRYEDMLEACRLRHGSNSVLIPPTWDEVMREKLADA
jgi:hypothetical protein